MRVLRYVIQTTALMVAAGVVIWIVCGVLKRALQWAGWL